MAAPCVKEGQIVNPLALLTWSASSHAAASFKPTELEPMVVKAMEARSISHVG